MNPDDADAVINQLKYPRLSTEYLPKLGLDFIRSLQNRRLQHHGRCLDIQAFAEDELVRKEYKEVHCEMPGVPRSTFLMVFSPDGTKVASTHGNHNIYITDLRTGKNIQTLVGHPRTPWCVAFHPSYNDIIASGCLGGQVRIWDLTGGSEVWTAENETVIASIAFHPIDRMLVIATFNELHFWDWSMPTPFACIATANTKEKVRYVEFDKMGHKLITGITNVPISRWDRSRTGSTCRVERGRFPLTPPSPPDRAQQYRRRVAMPRIVSTYSPYTHSQPSTSSVPQGERVPLSTVPERERRITACYQNLVHEYELLVHRYLQVYSPPTMMDRGTDPMEVDPLNTAGPSSSSTTATSNRTSSVPATSRTAEQNPRPRSNSYRIRCGMFLSRVRHPRERSSSAHTSTSNTSARRRLLLSTSETSEGRSNNDSSEPSAPHRPPDGHFKIRFKMRIKCVPKPAVKGLLNKCGPPRPDLPKPPSSNTTSNSFDKARPLWVSPNKRSHPGFVKTKKNNRKPILDTSSDNTSSDDDIARKRLAVNQANRSSEPGASTSSGYTASGERTNSAPVCTDCRPVPDEPSTSSAGCVRVPQATTTNPPPSNSHVYTSRTRAILEEQGAIPPLSPDRNPSAQDELINYSERSNAEGDLLNPPVSEFHPFDPPPEFPSINPENIGIGNMYSNIVQDLESSLNNVRNIRASNRPGETSDMLSSFSDRLESIMQQSDSILRNLSHAMHTLPANSRQGDNRAQGSSLSTPDVSNLESASPSVIADAESRLLAQIDRYNDLIGHSRPNNTQQRPPLDNDLSPTIIVENNSSRVVYNDANFYVREYNHSYRALNPNPLDTVDGTRSPQELYNNRNSVASDHSYHADSPRIIQQETENLTPLMTSLHLTISHIRRQARLLRRQVESIERIDRAMLEVAQLQSVRQLFGELRRHLGNLAGEHRSTGVSSVRQMMAGTRISDSSPGESYAEDEQSSSPPPPPPPPPPHNNIVTGRTANTSNTQPSRSQATGRKQLPPSRLLHLQRQNRRFAVVNLLPRRYNTRNRYARQRLYLRSFSVRHRISDMPDHFGSTITSSTITGMIRRLETHLTHHIGSIGQSRQTQTSTNFANEIGEIAINERLRLCRVRMNRIVNDNTEVEAANINVTPDGVSRYPARNTLSRILETLTIFLSQNNNSRLISQGLHVQLRNVIDLTCLLSDILLLQIVDSIPPPTGINLDPERESLSASIDNMCGRMLQRRVIGQSHSLNRSLRLMRLTSRYAGNALDQTYNAIFTNSNSSRREIIGQLHSTLRNIRSRGLPYYIPLGSFDNNQEPSIATPVSSWYHSVLLGRISDSNSSGAAQDVSNSDDDNDSWYNSDNGQALYRATRVNLVDTDGAAPSSSSEQNRLWNLPTVQINDVPISEPFGAWQSRLSQTRYRLSDLRSNPMLNFFRPRFLHPLYAGPLFDSSDLEDRREQLNDGEAIMTFTPNHRIQAWDVSTGELPEINNSSKNIVVAECKIHNDASVDLSTDGTLLVTLLPSGGYLNVTNRLGVYSLRWESLGQILYITSFEQNVVSVSLSPMSRHLVVGLASRRVSLIPNEKWTMARIFLLSSNDYAYGGRLPVLRELEQSRDTSYMSLNCIRWLPVSGQGLIIATNTGQLRILS